MLNESRQLEALYTAKSKFNSAKTNITELENTPEGSKLLVPLNQSLYVPGKILEPCKVMVELGTGYFCEKEIPAAKQLLDRKVNNSYVLFSTVYEITMTYLVAITR